MTYTQDFLHNNPIVTRACGGAPVIGRRLSALATCGFCHGVQTHRRFTIGLAALVHSVKLIHGCFNHSLVETWLMVESTTVSTGPGWINHGWFNRPNISDAGYSLKTSDLYCHSDFPADLRLKDEESATKWFYSVEGPC